MTIFRKQILLSLIFSLTIITSMIFSTWSAHRLSQIYSTMNEGVRLQIQSKEIISLMKDIVFDFFSPQEYGQLRNLTYAPRSIVTVRQWKKSVDFYRQKFWLFMNSSGLLNIKDDEFLEQRETAIILNTKAMAKLDFMEQLFEKLKKLSQENPGNLYGLMQKDAELIPFFSEFQKTSYYFTNSFESFMNHFQNSLQNASDKLVKRTYLFSLTVVIVLGVFSIVVALLISRDIIVKLGFMEKTFGNISRGDFSAATGPYGSDEFGKLLSKVNEFVGTLQVNIDAILNLTKDLGRSISDKMELEDILQLMVNGILKDTSAEGAGVIMFGNQAEEAIRLSVGGAIPEEFMHQFDFMLLKKEMTVSGRDVVVEELRVEYYEGYAAIVPLIIHNDILGFMIVVRNSEMGPFTDLGIIRLETFSEYSSMVIDNYFHYREILEKQDAEYLALQAQTQPHFLYNVLSSFMGLNRMGDSSGLEDAITDLRDMLRYVQNRQRETTVADELTFITRYLDLQKIRFQERLTYIIEATGNSDGIIIPRLLLQPLVENALIHGLEPLEMGGLISVKTELIEKGTLFIFIVEIFNSGNGFSSNYTPEHRGIGLNNVKTRLRLAYPDSNFSITTPESGGALVKISIFNPKRI